MPSADIHDRTDAVKIVSLGHGGTIDRGYSGHGVIEDLRFLRMLLKYSKKGTP